MPPADLSGRGHNKRKGKKSYSVLRQNQLRQQKIFKMWQNKNTNKTFEFKLFLTLYLPLQVHYMYIQWPIIVKPEFQDNIFCSIR